jgi:Flp pilus assembly protein TadD/2-polyprenyl-3-methyl-5-hydroxy-6-metoxy-1,4-benzoquinol methylase
MPEKINHKIVPKEVVDSFINLYKQGEFRQILEKEKKFASFYQDSIEVLNIFGSNNLALQNFKRAITNFNKAIKLNPNIPTIYYNLGLAFHHIGNMDDAIVNYKKAIEIKPDYDEALNNMGMSLEEKGDVEGAIDKYNKVLATNPNHAGAYYNLGNVFCSKDNLILAIQNYNKAISIKPDYAEAYYNMGIALQKQGKIKEAIESYNKTLLLKPNYAQAYNNIGDALTRIIFKKPNRSLQNTISSLLDKKFYVLPKDIAVAAISLLKFEPSLQKQLKFVRFNKVIQNPLNIVKDLDELPLLRKLMSVCPLPDLELEKLFKQLRTSILENILSLEEAPPELLRFQSALALQCFTNEYIYSQSKSEEKATNVLEKKIKELLSNNQQPSPLAILILASYKALHKYDWCQSLIVNNQIQEVFTRQVEEPNQEEKLKLNIPILEEIRNKVSSNVRQQYEESPYPRWVNLGLSLKSMSISNVVDEFKLKLHSEKVNGAKSPDILIAGCGTGQHSITTAARFKSSKILAIDLSLSRLAYAKRKTEELAIKNIEYIQVDILDLSKLNKQFDIIESGGVLHHMHNPIKGWKVLTDCLKPGGLMKIGLYSELARQNVVKIREEISQKRIGSSKIEMKSFRDMIIESEKAFYKQIIIMMISSA